MQLVKTSILALLCLICTLLPGQSPYEFNWRKEVTLLGVGTTTLSAGLLIHLQVKPYPEASIYRMNRSEVLSFDLLATYNISKKASNSSDYLVSGAYLTPLLFLPFRKSRSHFGQISLLYAETMLLTKGITILTKRLVKRPRPFVFNEHADLSDKLGLSARFSFFSGHTSISAASCFFTASVFEDFFPDSKWKPYIWGVAMTVPALTGYLRVAAGKHYPSDVVTGYIVGGLIGFIIPKWHKRSRLHAKRHLTLIPAPDRLVLNLQF